jgi:hypothetical protein
MTRATALVFAQGLDLVTFAVAIVMLGVPVSAEYNGLFVAALSRGGILLVLALKLALVSLMLALATRLNRDRTLGYLIIGGLGLLGAFSNVWTSIIWLNVRGY